MPKRLLAKLSTNKKTASIILYTINAQVQNVTWAFWRDIRSLVVLMKYLMMECYKKGTKNRKDKQIDWIEIIDNDIINSESGR